MGERLQTILSDILSRLSLSGGDLFNIVFSIILALVMALVISQVYKRTQRGMNHEVTFLSSLVILAPIVTLVMLFIRGDLIVSLGLIGSLSIIRFRSAIKDTRDMVFLFWSIVVGLGAGTLNWSTVVIGSIIILAAIFILYLIKYGKSQSLDYILIISGDNASKYEQIEQIINKFVLHAQIRSQTVEDNTSEIVMELVFPSHSPQEFESMINELHGLSFVRNVSLLSPQLSLPV